MRACLNYDVVELMNDNSISDILIKNHVFIIEDLWKLKRKDLKDYGLNDNQINTIIIKLQLLGIDLNKKVNK